jgi:HTH-type transcriptional regulator / antitoxin HigA
MNPIINNDESTPTFAPDWAVAPGEILAEELKARGMSQTDFASRTSLSIKHINQLINHNVPLTADVAVSFERALGVTAATWLQIEAQWQAHTSAAAATQSLSKYASWLTNFPLSALVARKVLDGRTDVPSQVEQLLRFFQVTNPAAFDKVWLQPQVNYKRSQSNKLDPYATATWIRLAERQAQTRAADAPEYSTKLLRAAARELPAITSLPLIEGFEAARDLLQRVGVMLVFVEPLDKTGLFGISKTLDDGRHMIGLTGRMRSLDSFWFALAHEIAHILLHPKRSTFIDTKTSFADDDRDDQESEANQYASDLLVPPTSRQKLLDAGPAAVSTIASELGVAVAIVAGQYAHLADAYPAMSRYRPRIDDKQIRELQTVSDTTTANGHPRRFA